MSCYSTDTVGTRDYEMPPANHETESIYYIPLLLVYAIVREERITTKMCHTLRSIDTMVTLITYK